MEPGSSLGPYELVGPLGAGGMGEVYRARDRRIGRDVAIKVLPHSVAADADRLRRLEIEARAAGSLSHPNLVTIYEFGTTNDQPYIAMELLEGASLREKLGDSGSPRIPLRKAVEYAIQIANGLAAAHEKGIVHRDLKPENIFVTADGRVKILDFGLAKQTAAFEEDKTASHSDQLKTSPGTIIGTASYMSPEQVRGDPVDQRSDIFAAGAILFEMLYGRRAFRGTSAIETMNAILKEDPASSGSDVRRVPLSLNRVVLRCLEKDREQRFQSARDLAYALLAVETSTISAYPLAIGATRRGEKASVLAAIVIVTIGVALLALQFVRRPAPRAPFTDFRQLTFQEGLEDEPTVSPDGKTVAFVSRADGDDDIYVQRLDGRNTINLTADSKAADTVPAFSPDGERIAFASMRDGGGIYVMGATGESVRRLTTFGSHPAWSPDGQEIVFCTEEVTSPAGRSYTSELWIVRVADGVRRKLYAGDAVQPAWSPNGKLIAFWAVAANAQRDLFVIPAAGGGVVRVTNDAALDWRPVWARDGKSLFYLSDANGTRNLWRVPVAHDGSRDGDPRMVTLPAGAIGWFSIGGGEIVYTSAAETTSIQRAVTDPRTLEPIGMASSVLSGTMVVRSFDVSPDGSMVAFTPEGRQEDVFVVRSDGTALRQLTDDAARDRGVRWSHDGRRIAFYSNRSGNYEIWQISADGGTLQQLTHFGTPNNWHAQWSPDDRMLATSDATGSWIVPVDGKARPQRLPPVPGGETFTATSWSPDARFIAGNLATATDDDDGGAIYSIAARTYTRLPKEMLYPEWLRDGTRIVGFSEAQKRVVMYDMATHALTTLPFTATGRLRERFFAVVPDGSSVFTATTASEADLWAARIDEEQR